MKNFRQQSSRKRKALLIFLAIICIGYLLPETFTMPVEGAGKSDYNQESFWYYPWGRSGTHKGVDIFAKEGTNVRAATGGIVIYSGTMGMGGNVVLVLGPKWHVHYYAHLSKQHAETFDSVSSGECIGEVGTTGNAAGKSPHLHYSIATIIPYLWQMDSDHQGWKKMFYVDPTPALNAAPERPALQ